MLCKILLSFAMGCIMREKLINTLLYLRTLIEDEKGVMSARRVGFLTALFAVLYVVIFKPETITENVVGALREILIVVALVYGVPRTAESVVEAIEAIREARVR